MWHPDRPAWIVGQYNEREWTDPWSKVCRGRDRALVIRETTEWLATLEPPGDYDLGECFGYPCCGCPACYDRPDWIDVEREVFFIVDEDEKRRRRVLAALAGT